MINVISGGQTGVDIAGLFSAVVCNYPTGGWAPKGFKTKAGPKPLLESEFYLKEHSGGYRERTIENLLLADATLVFSRYFSEGGTGLTINQCKKNNKPVLLIPEQFDASHVKEATEFINSYKTINCAGNSHATAPGIFYTACDFFITVFSGDETASKRLSQFILQFQNGFENYKSPY